MALPSPRRRVRRLVVTAVTVGVLSLVALVVVVVAVARGGGPEEEVAQAYLTDLYAGDAEAAYEHLAPSVRGVIFVSDLEELAEAVVAAAGEAEVDVVGAQRTDDRPPQSIVGYQGTGSSGPVRGVVSLVQFGGDDPSGWGVLAASYRFPEAPPDATTQLDRVIQTLNAQIERRLGDLEVTQTP